MPAAVALPPRSGRHHPDLVVVFLRWTFARAFLHRGWWLVTSVHLVVDAGLSPSRLVAITVGQGLVSLLFEIPAGVLADTVSRRWSLVVSHVLMGSAMLATGLVTDFPALVATQMLWGLSWTFASGADVAWLTDELARPDRIAAVLVRAGRTQLLGSAAGIVGLGALASVVRRDTTMVLAGAAVLVLGLYVLLRFREERFRAAGAGRWAASRSILVDGARLVRRSRVLMVVFAATVLVNGAHEFGRLYPLRLVEIGFPAEPLFWFTGLNVLVLLVGALVLRLVEARVHEVRVGRSAYVLGCLAGAAGLVVLAGAPEPVSGAAAVVMVAGTTDPVFRTIGTIWVNERAEREVRATVHSFLAQAEYVGEILCGAALAVAAAAAGTTAALLFCAGLFATSALLVRRAV
jgi:MFS family permease